MKLWILDRKPNHLSWDVVNTYLVRAESEDRAREIANERNFGDQGPIWHDPEQALCHELVAPGEEGILMMDFNAG